jgi:hypothetical protein
VDDWPQRRGFKTTDHALSLLGVWKMEERNAKAFKWLVNRITKKTKVEREVVISVLGAVADMQWDWEHSRYDLYGLQLEEILEDLGKERAPK